MPRFGRTGVRGLVLLLAWAMLASGGGAPVAAAGPGVSAFASGEQHTCALRTNGTVWCWGGATFGQLGDGTTGDVDGIRTSPVQVRRGSTTLTGVTRVTSGSLHSCAVRTGGTVWCWGTASDGQLGNGQSGPGAHRTRAVQVRRGSGHLTGVVQLAAGLGHTCALRADGAVLCWGRAAQGQVGDGTFGDSDGQRTTPVRVRRGSGYLDDVIAIASGDYHVCVIRSGGSVFCWGDGIHGQLGDGESGTDHRRSMPTRVRRGSAYLTHASGIAAGADHTCVRRTDGTAWCWGIGEYGQLGDGTRGGSTTGIRTRPVQVRRGSGVLTGVAGIGAGTTHTCARRTDGSAWCWGFAREGQLGDGTTGDATDNLRLKPVRVVRPSGSFIGVRRLDGGDRHTCALRTDKSMWCWGGNDRGQLGRGSHDDDPHPYPRRVLFP